MSDTKTANAEALAAVNADPVAMAERLAVLPWLADRLAEWPDPWESNTPPTVDGPDGPRVHPAWLASGAGDHLAQVRNADRMGVRNPKGLRRDAARWAVEKLADLPEAPDSTSGVSLLAAAIEELPPEAAAETRPDPLLPVVQVSESPEREAGRLTFGGILEAGERPPPGQLPLFPAPDGPRVPLLELVDAHGVPTMVQGRGAPLELATYVAACIMTPHDLRATRGRIVTTVRELAGFLFGPGKWKPGPKGDRPGHWERVREAALSAGRLWLPLDNGDLWRAVAVRRIPPADYEPGHLDRRIIFDIELPPGAAHGPEIDRADLSRLRRRSGPAFRAYIAAHSVAWRPGRTRVRHPRNPAFWLWSGDPGKYPVLTAADRRRLAFGDGDTRNRTRAEQDAPWEQLPGSVILTRKATTQDGRRGWLIVPEAAANAIRKRQEA